MRPVQQLSPPQKAGAEEICPLVEGGSFRLEKIVSRGDRSPEGFWYDQEADEWVLLLSGQATLEFETGQVDMAAGESLLIPAHQKHRVTSTSLDAVWLALHYSPTPLRQEQADKDPGGGKK